MSLPWAGFFPASSGLFRARVPFQGQGFARIQCHKESHKRHFAQDFKERAMQLVSDPKPLASKVLVAN